ncbi:MAG: O-antigen ligase [Bacteroidota bacterium]|nr:O-antigen ligase [Bacteroidota bacterium]
MPDKKKISWVYGICALFVALNAYLMVRDVYWSLLIPLGLLLVYLYIYALDKIILLVTFLTPIAINMTDSEFGVGISLPTEPLLFGVLIMFMLKIIFDNHYDGRIMKHPLTLIILIDLGWMLITSITSQIPLVSFKYLLARLWFVIPFFFLGIPLFKKEKNIQNFIWLYAIPLVGVIGYTIYNHSLWGFNEQAGHWVMEPFYNDHTAYGAILAMYIPVFAGFSFSKSFSKTVRFFSFLVLVILLVAIVLSFSRAAWVSLAFAIVVYLIVIFKIKVRWILFTLAFLIGGFMVFQNEIFDKLEKNKQGSSANFIEHVQSISNISTDDSNLERINRWQSAFRMFSDHPFFGFGPNTYQFEYAPYQHSNEKTRISTNAGDRGNAHSEYIGPLAESGILGFLCKVAIVITMLVIGLRVYHEAADSRVKMISISVLLGLITYFFHGTMNDFLDSDKASIPVWGFIAILVSLDLYYPKKEKEKKEISLDSSEEIS